MDLDKQAVKIKYELHEEIDIDTVKVENEDPNESVCIKSENAEISDSAGLELDNGVYQSATDKMRIKTEIPDIATKQDREDLSITSLLQTNSYTCYSAWPRKQVEQTKENWGKTSFNKVASKEVKVEDDAKVQCEDKDNSELNQQLDVHMKINSTAPSAELDLDSEMEKKDWHKEHEVAQTEVLKNMFICYFCRYETHSKNELVEHFGVGSCNINSTLNKAKVALARAPSSSKSVSKCEQCEFVATRHDILKMHDRLKHSGVRHCSQTFSDTRDEHIIKKHRKFILSISREIYECANCSYQTVHEHNLTAHNKVFHTHVKSRKKKVTNIRISEASSYSCNHCNKFFCSKRDVNNHIVKAHPEGIDTVDSEIYRCFCEFKTTRKYNFERHQSLVHGMTNDLKFFVASTVNTNQNAKKI